MAVMTCLDVIADAMRWRGVLDAVEEPDPADAAAGLRVLKGVYLDIARRVTLRRVEIDDAYTASENVLIVNDSADAAEITFPTSITVDDPIELPDGSTTTTRPPHDRSVVMIAGETPQAFLYDEAIADWIDINALRLPDSAPVSAKFAEGLAAAVCVRLRYPRVQLDPTATIASAGFWSAMAGRWDVGERDPLETTYF
jgi:hypothetical protein